MEDEQVVLVLGGTREKSVVIVSERAAIVLKNLALFSLLLANGEILFSIQQEFEQKHV